MALLHSMSVSVTGFEHLPEAYPTCPDFEEIYKLLSENPSSSIQGFLLKDGFLFKGNKLCIPQTSLRDFLVWEMHAGELQATLVPIRPLPLWRTGSIGQLSSEMLPK
eukprot:TRINITY_DN22183_c0_g1_i1.p1 TRINITY_DN22183_c0_g1~~TRINITY_DN22183_c0_g1_i1.p1  ORF type:complete len:107 (+),score=10.63 TRINITY_DN22183_c0_g1_i1:344-664(+)